MVIERINNNLSAVFNVDDPIYRSLICDKDYTPIDPDLSEYGTAEYGTGVYSTLKPTKNDIGALASQIEYLREMGIFLLEQIFIDTAAREFLKYQLETFFSSYQLENETFVEWIQKTYTTVFSSKVSNAAIKYALWPYSSRVPDIYNVVTESAYADFSFADCYLKTDVVFEGETVHVLPAIAETEASSSFTIRIVLYDTSSDDIFTVANIIENIIAAGIFYILEIQYTI